MRRGEQQCDPRRGRQFCRPSLREKLIGEAGVIVCGERSMRRMLREVVKTGTGKNAAVEGLDVGGKTGTTIKVDPATKRYTKGKYTSSFVAIAPTDEARVCVAAFLKGRPCGTLQSLCHPSRAGPNAATDGPSRCAKAAGRPPRRLRAGESLHPARCGMRLPHSIVPAGPAGKQSAATRDFRWPQHPVVMCDPTEVESLD
jgi:hypothetical protein